MNVAAVSQKSVSVSVVNTKKSKSTTMIGSIGSGEINERTLHIL